MTTPDELAHAERLRRIHELQNIEASAPALLDELTELQNRLFEERAFLVMDFPPDEPGAQPAERNMPQNSDDNPGD